MRGCPVQGARSRCWPRRFCLGPLGHIRGSLEVFPCRRSSADLCTGVKSVNVTRPVIFPSLMHAGWDCQRTIFFNCLGYIKCSACLSSTLYFSLKGTKSWGSLINAVVRLCRQAGPWFGSTRAALGTVLLIWSHLGCHCRDVVCQGLVM